MVLEPQNTTVAYRCPHCGAAVYSGVNLFMLTADMLKLKCTCGHSEMSLIRSTTDDQRVRLIVPCLLCPKPHQFTISRTLLFDKELFSLPCPYSDITLACVGETDLVKGELARSELELMDLLESMGYEGALLGGADDEDALTDPQVLDIVMFVINDLDAEGKIYCKCDPTDNGRQYDAEVRGDGVRVSCRKCAASRLIPTDSSLAAHSFLNTDALHLE